MGAEQSSNERRYQTAPPAQMSEAQVQRLLEAQRSQYERKLEEVAARAAAQRRQEEAAKAAAQRREEAAKAEAQKREELAAQRRQEEAAALKKQQEEAARAAAQNSPFSIERDRAPYSYSGNQLQQAAAAPPIIERDRAPYNYSGNQLQQAAAAPPMYGYPPMYPNLNQGPGTPNNRQFVNNNPFRPQNDGFVFVENFAQNQSYNRPGPAPSAPSAPRGNRGPSPRPRSVSRPRNAPKERDVFDCPTCNARFGMKIFQCDSGHSSCCDCKNRGRACGICRMPLTNRRNFDLENHVSQTKAPCPHASEGCKLFIKVADMDSHVKECPFKEQNCPINAVFGTCHWKGKSSEISSHFDSMHPSGRQTNVDTEMHLTNVRNNSQQVHLIVLGVYNFLLHVKVSETDGKVYLAVQLIGTKFSAQKWLYEIHVFNKSESRRKYMYTDNCCSSNDKIEDVFKAGECAVLPVWHANTFVCNGSLVFKFFIKKSNEEKKVFAKNQRGRGRHHS